MHGRLHGKIALILDGDSEIAAATAVRFAREGARVALCGRHAERLEDTATCVADAGGSAYVLQADPTHESQIAAVLDEAVGQFGTVDILVCCTALRGSTGTPAVAAAADKALVAMAARGGGVIVIVAPPSSGEAERAEGAARAADETLARRLAIEGAARSVRANVVVPGLIATEDVLARFADASVRKHAEQSIPLGRLGRPDDVAATIAFLASDDASYITGAAVTVDGGRDAHRRAPSPR